MSRLILAVMLALGLLFTAVAPSALHAQSLNAEDRKKIADARTVISEVEAEQEARAESFSGLLELRERIEPVRDTLKAIVADLQQKLTSEAAQLTELGPAPAAGAPAEAPAIAASRSQKQAVVNEIDGQLRSTRALLVQAEQIWGEINEARRELFTSRIFTYQNSVLYPRFWRQLFEQSMPNLRERLAFKAQELSRGMDQRESWPVVVALLGITAAVAGLLTWLRRIFERFRARAIAEAEAGAQQGPHCRLCLSGAGRPRGALCGGVADPLDRGCTLRCRSGGHQVLPAGARRRHCRLWRGHRRHPCRVFAARGRLPDHPDRRRHGGPVGRVSSTSFWRPI